MANQNTIHSMYKAPKWTGLKMQAYTSSSKTGERKQNSLDTVLSHIRNHETKLKYVSLWAGKEARPYLSTVSKDRKDSLKTMLDALKDWTKLKSDEIVALTPQSPKPR